jgi:hypothetical protein
MFNIPELIMELLPHSSTLPIIAEKIAEATQLN